MTRGDRLRVAKLDNGHNGYCVENPVGVTYCGEAFDPRSSSASATRSIAVTIPA